jgi:hypothetical protein
MGELFDLIFFGVGGMVVLGALGGWCGLGCGVVWFGESWWGMIRVDSGFGVSTGLWTGLGT